MSDKAAFDRYLLALRKTPVDEKTEHTDRAALQSLLQAVADAGASGVGVQHEPKRAADKGAPDFKITKGGLILGYVENKVIGENLDKVLKSGQISRYKTLSQNIILTDYLHFIWINKDGVQREALCHATDLENRRFQLREDRIAAVSQLLAGFFSTAPEGIGRAQQLAMALATRSKLLRDYLARSWCGRNGSTRRGGSMAFSKSSAIKSSMSSRSRNLPMPSRKCWPTACFSHGLIRIHNQLRSMMHGNTYRARSD